MKNKSLIISLLFLIIPLVLASPLILDQTNRQNNTYSLAIEKSSPSPTYLKNNIRVYSKIPYNIPYFNALNNRRVNTNSEQKPDLGLEYYDSKKHGAIDLTIENIYALGVTSNNPNLENLDLIAGKQYLGVIEPVVSGKKEEILIGPVRFFFTWKYYYPGIKASSTKWSDKYYLLKLGEETYAFNEKELQNKKILEELREILNNPNQNIKEVLLKTKGYNKVFISETSPFIPKNQGQTSFIGYIDCDDAIAELDEKNNKKSNNNVNIIKTKENYKLMWAFAKTNWKNHGEQFWSKATQEKIEKDMKLLAYTLPVPNTEIIKGDDILLGQDTESDLKGKRDDEAFKDLILEISEKHCPEKYDRCVYIIPTGSMGDVSGGSVFIKGKSSPAHAVLVTDDARTAVYWEEIAHTYGVPDDFTEKNLASEGYDFTKLSRKKPYKHYPEDRKKTYVIFDFWSAMAQNANEKWVSPKMWKQEIKGILKEN